MKFQAIVSGIAAAAVSFSFTGSFAGCGLEECLNVGSDDAEEFIECASRSFDDEFIAPVDAQYLKANLKRFAEKLKAMKEAEDQEREAMMITDELLEGLREQGDELKGKLTVDVVGLSSPHDSPATTNESAETQVSPTAIVHPLVRKPSEKIPITPIIGRQRAATDSLVDLKQDTRQMAYSYVAETPKAASLMAKANLREPRRFANIFVAPEVALEDGQEEEGSEVHSEKEEGGSDVQSDYDLDLGGWVDEVMAAEANKAGLEEPIEGMFQMDEDI